MAGHIVVQLVGYEKEIFELVDSYLEDGLEMADSLAVTLGKRLCMVIGQVSFELVEISSEDGLEMEGCLAVILGRDCSVTVEFLWDSSLI